MAAQEDEIKSLKEKNNELVQKVQYWKMTAAQRENEKLELMKEVNELRLKVIRLKSGGAASARKLEAALQAASTQALSHLVEASGAVARTLELAKSHAREYAEHGAAAASARARWSGGGSGGSAERVHRVPPLMIGGQSIQPVVSLSRAAFNVNTSRQTSRSPNSTRNVTVRAVPMHMLQDVYIPLTRIDVRDIPNNNDTEPEAAADDSADNIPFDTSMEEAADEEDEDYDSSRRLDVVEEDAEPEEGAEERTPPRLAGAGAGVGAGAGTPRAGPSRAEPEPDSTTADTSNTHTHTPEAALQPSPSPTPTPSPSPPASPPSPSPSPSPPASPPSPSPAPSPSPSPPARVFTPTLRRRKRSATPPSPPPPPPPRNSIQVHTPNGAALCSRVLQVRLPKLPVPGVAGVGAGVAGGAGAAGDATPAGSPCKRRALAPRFDAPSPNGATERVIVSEEVESPAVQPQHAPAAPGGATHARDDHRSHDSRGQESWRRDSGDSDSSEVNEGRARRNRRPVTYKERPLNRKLRR